MFLFYSFKVFQTTQKFFPFVVNLISLLVFQKGKKVPNRTQISHHLFYQKMVFFQDLKKGQDNTQKEKNMYFLSRGILRRPLNKVVTAFLKKNLKMRTLFWLFF
ncbi:hypothetical protein HPSA_07645 [Helicobacter pylori SouthAfrica7]|uniref:Uncharacterized protein n=1 Tax=Helicobacter pylori (strain SouthAfrica7) TaxID=907239 RepID=E8QUJ4_HELPW|nr:hypothetical protein HPSA_07645 [Helicobacter pylori SouthAfrica7]